MSGKALSMKRHGAVTLPINHNMPVSFFGTAPAWLRTSYTLPRFLDDEIAGASRIAPRASRLGAPVRTMWFPARVWLRFLAWRERRAVRRTLNELDAHLLADIGLARCDIDRVVARIEWHNVKARLPF